MLYLRTKISNITNYCHLFILNFFDLLLGDHSTHIPIQFCGWVGRLDFLKYDIDKYRDFYGRTSLHHIAYSITSDFEKSIFAKLLITLKVKYLIKHPLVAIVKDNYSQTPLHILATHNRVEVLKHPDVGIAKDSEGVTPLHCLALSGNAKVLEHKQLLTITDNFSNTPLHSFFDSSQLSVTHLKKLFPWYSFSNKNTAISRKLINFLINPPKSLLFIMNED